MRTCEHAATEQLGQKTRRQDFCRRYTQKVCKYPNSKRFQKVHTYIHTCIHANKHTYIHTYRQTDRQTYLRTYIHTYIHTYIRTYIQPYMRTCEHAATEQLGQKTRRQDFCRRYTQKVCKYPNSKRFQKVHTYIHTCIHANKHTYIHTDRQTDIHTYVRTYIHTYMYACIHTHMPNACVLTVHAQCTPQCTRRKCCK